MNETLDRARELVQMLEKGDEAEAMHLLEELGRVREQAMFQELGKLTREIHDALKNFQIDSRIASLAEKDIPDAKDRLSYVISMTEQAAHRTINAVETSLPITDGVRERAETLGETWGRFLRRELDADEFRHLSRELEAFFKETQEAGTKVHADLSEVLMAQDYQDITGQIIRRVITLVQDVEESLVEIIRISGRHAKPAQPEQQQQDAQEAIKAEGPQVPGVDTAANVVSGQDEVDDLLASLGF